MRRNQHDHSANICEQQREPAQQQQYRHHHHQNHHYNNHRVPPPSTSVAREQHIGHRMSLETLLQAAYYVEQEEKKRERLASTSSSSSSSDQHSFVSAPPHSNHTYASSEPRGAKFKKERTEPDDLFCEEKMLIIDGRNVTAQERLKSCDTTITAPSLPPPPLSS